MNEPQPIEQWMIHTTEGPDFPVRLGTDEQLARTQQDLFAQYQGYRAQAQELLSKAENALSGANLLAYELDRRSKLNGGH